MQLEMRKVKLNSPEIKRIYFEAFPPKERMPFPMMVGMSKLWNTEFLGFYDEGLPLGLAYFAFNRKMVFLMFLAVDQSFRSKGYGSAVLEQIKRKYSGQKIVVSIEPCWENTEDREVRKRRKAFYLQNGYLETGYLMKLNGVTQEILIANGAFAKKEFCRFLFAYSFGSLYPKLWLQTV